MPRMHQATILEEESGQNIAIQKLREPNYEIQLVSMTAVYEAIGDCKKKAQKLRIVENVHNSLLGQWLNSKLFGIAYLVGKIEFKLVFQGPWAK